VERKILVLLADDSAAMRASLRALLNDHDDLRVVAEACNGQVALAQAQEIRPDVLVMDLQMPAMDGLAVLKALRSSSLAGLPVILISASLCQVIREQALEAGAYAVLGKEDLDTVPDLVRAAARGK